MLDHLLQDRLLSPDQYSSVNEAITRTGESAEETILDRGYLTEAKLLKSLAAHYKTNYVPTEKLARADVSRATLDMIPRKFAETMVIFPVMFDPRTNTLSIVTSAPDNLALLEEVKVASGARVVKAFLSRPAAVKAAIARAYSGDVNAFVAIEKPAAQSMFDVYEPGSITELQAIGQARETTMSQRPRHEESVAAQAPALPPPPVASSPRATDISSSTDPILELMSVLVSLLEGSRQDLRGHSSQVARLVRQIAQRMKLDSANTSALVMAAYIHDLGKMGQYHLTALNVSEYDGHRLAAQKSYGTPARLLSAVKLSHKAIEAVSRMYERYDGKGFPDGLMGKDIPLSSRILAIADTYADLTQNPRNPFRKTLKPNEACAAISKYKNVIFDPNLVELLHHTVLDEDLRARLLANRYTALIVDVDPEETTVVELRMHEQGFIVKTARSVEQALKLLAEGDIDLVVSDLEIGQSDGLVLLAEARKYPWGENLPWVIYTRRHERSDAQKAFELGVLDFVAKPAPTEVLVAKLKALLDQRAATGGPRGVSGSLKEMSLPDMIQVLWHGRKTGSLKIRSRGEAGEIHLQDGNVVNAAWANTRGENAFYEMLKLDDGDFVLDPSFRPPARVIHQSSEALLLEGMRRLDESR